MPTVIKFLDKHPLITKKRADYLLFKLAINLVLNKAHLTVEGLNKIVAIKASMNRGLSSGIEAAFPNILPVERPFIQDSPIPGPQWLAGFTSGEGCFFIVIQKSKDTKLGEAVQLKFILVQHSRDEKIMKSLIEYFKCGNLLKKRETVHFSVTKFTDLTEKIIPFFLKYPVLGVKSKREPKKIN